MQDILIPVEDESNEGSKTSNSSNSDDLIENTDFVENTDIVESDNYNFIPSSVYNKLPAFLKKVTEVFTTRRERDIFLTGAISALGGCFYNVFAYNSVDKTKLSPNIFSFIVAPPASGKNALMYASKLISKISATFKQKSYTGSKGLIIPGNNTSAGIIKFLKDNLGIGVIIEAEIDTIVNAHKQDWGNYSDLLRESFENNTYRYYRKTKNDFIEIESVKLSMALSGTPNQFVSLIKSPENGLFSRGCYYVFNDEITEIKCFDRLRSDKPIAEQFIDFAETAKEYFNKLETQEEVIINFSREQLQKIQDVVEEEYYYIDSTPLKANILRTFMVVQKIATTLSVLAMEDEIQQSIECSEENLTVAIQLAVTYLRHSYKALELLHKNNNKQKSNISFKEKRILEKLPDSFTRAEAIKLLESLNYSSKTVDVTLKKLVEKKILEMVKRGTFHKVEKANEENDDINLQ
jgi:hypothetical protein